MDNHIKERHKKKESKKKQEKKKNKKKKGARRQRPPPAMQPTSLSRMPEGLFLQGQRYKPFGWSERRVAVVDMADDETHFRGA